MVYKTLHVGEVVSRDGKDRWTITDTKPESAVIVIRNNKTGVSMSCSPWNVKRVEEETKETKSDGD